MSSVTGSGRRRRGTTRLRIREGPSKLCSVQTKNPSILLLFRLKEFLASLQRDKSSLISCFVLSRHKKKDPPLSDKNTQ